MAANNGATNSRMSNEPIEMLLSKLLENASKPEEERLLTNQPASSPARIAIEHNFAKLVPFRSSHGTGGKDSSFPTVFLFPERVTSKHKNRKMKSKKLQQHGRVRGPRMVEEFQNSHGEVSTEEGDNSGTLISMDAELLEGVGAVSSASDHEIDVTSIDSGVTLPYDEKKVSTIMVECTRHINLVKVPTDITESEALIGRTLSEANCKQKTLLKQLVDILQEDNLARLTCAAIPNEPVKRRLNTDRAARKFRKVLANIKWDPKLTRWCHETLLRTLDTTLLPIYLDILQVLKAKCPVLVEHMIHSSMSMAGGEAFGLLLKRPWNPASGLYNNEKQMKFEPAPIFVSLPYTTTGLGGRRWRMWQNQLSAVGKVYPIILPENLTDISLSVSFSEVTKQMLMFSLQRVQELSSQFPTRPVVLIGFSLAGRIAAKIAEVLSISLIISLGLPSSGLEHKWKVPSDIFKDCHSPTFFAVGSESRLSSVMYTEKLRNKMKCATSLVVVGGGDDLLRLSLEDKQLEEVTQTIVDRCILDEIYKFMVHNLTCSFPEEQPRLVPRKRKIAHSEELNSTFLTPVVSQGPIILTPATEDSVYDGKNYNLNNSSPFWRTFLSLKQSGRVSPARSLSGSPSPIALLERRLSGEGIPTAKRMAHELLPKSGRPRSKSTAIDKPKSKTPARARSSSSDQTNKHSHSEDKSNSSTFTPIISVLNRNSNNNNNVSPPNSGMLALPMTHFRPLPITPPRNPYADQPVIGRQLDPKTLRHLQLK